MSSLLRKKPTSLISPKDIPVPDDVDYFHFTSNNTIYGTEMRFDPDVNVPLVADMSSDIFSRPIDVSKYNVIYAGAQKNLAPAGVTIVIVKEEALGHVDRLSPPCSTIAPTSKKDRCSIRLPVSPSTRHCRP